MAFTGRLEGLTVPEVLQILGLLKKTGKLTLTRLGSSGVVVFRNGEVTFAASDSVRTILGTTLIRQEYLTENALRAALELQHGSPQWKRLGAILVDQGFITPHGLYKAIRHQMEQVILEFLTWETGFFRFESMEIAAEDDLIVGIDPEHLLRGELFQNIQGEETWEEYLKDFSRSLPLSR